MLQTVFNMRVIIAALFVCVALALPDGDDKKPLFKRAAPPKSSQISAAGLPIVSNDFLESALRDRRFVERQLKCATGEGPCDQIGKKLKENAPAILKGNCSKCTENEIKQTKRVLSHIEKNYPKEYARLLKQYDGLAEASDTIRGL
ncbi:putative odorant-binding protein A10 isoform X4 [Daktulosphaira vitifoliae]|uniref:Chemosensory protein 7 n=1 Tax=Daktulosphaira vitifoliae TaxID=58002 RepID=A0A1W6R6E8_DAKVI|nr:putative odorant-binding protein A10 isoform X3 [Daktulosphaira vitifoliae]XP_050525827.1 putative odorant-binding protein A10 isoform X4 [Daktulosphaira vitifoliae]ARO50011.1 chemosensory protein 7 [Daktulosphaira vitifoliae]